MKMNKQTWIALAAVVSTVTLPPAAQSAERSEAARPAGGERLAALRERMQETARELDLTPEQREKLTSIVRERLEKLRELHQDNSLSPQQKREKFQAAREEIAAEVKKVLTPEQFEKWEARRGQPAREVAQRPLARLEGAIKELNLTEEQKEKLRPIYREQMEKLRELRQDTSLSPQQKRERFQAAREELTAEVKKVLTPEQLGKWTARQGQPEGEVVQRPLARLEGAIKELNLTEAQKEQLKPIYQEQMEKLRELRQDDSLSMAERLEKLKALNKDIAPQLKKVLDAEQFAKWQKQTEAWLEQLRQRFEGAKQN